MDNIADYVRTGTGTIADCWEAKVANVIVANPNLMDNHQAVFAEDMARDHETIVLGRLGYVAFLSHQPLSVDRQFSAAFTPFAAS